MSFLFVDSYVGQEVCALASHLFCFQSKGGVKSLRPSRELVVLGLGRGELKDLGKGGGLKILGLGGYHFFEREVSTSLPAMLFLFLF